MKKILLITIIALAAILRLWGLGEYPALNADEAAVGYNAYSLAQTGLDEHGNSWPVHFQSFNDFKPGIYFYIVLPFVKFFGLDVWSVRLPAALLGVLSVYLIYLLVKELFGKEKHALFSALLLAISPWHIHFSRGGWEVNVGTFFMTLGVLLFAKARSKPKLFTFSFLSFALSIYAYHSTRIVIPALGLGLLLIYKDSIVKNVKSFAKAIVIATIVLLPLLFDLVGGNVFSRAAGVGLFADTGPLSRINEQRGEHEDFRSLPALVFHNKLINYGLAFTKNWAEHYHGEFLFLSGDEIQRNKVPETGQLHLFELLFVAAGLIALVKKPKGWSPVLVWLGVAPIAAALTFQSPHALRAHNMVIPLTIISGFGAAKVFEVLSDSKKQRGILLVIFFGIIAWGLGRYAQMYWLHMSKEYPFSSQYGVEELVSYVASVEEKYDKVVVTDRYDQPYILFLFYSKYPPKEFQKDHVLSARDQYGFSTVRDFDKYTFISIGDWDQIRSDNPNSLIVGTDEEIPNEANVVKEIYGTNGYKYFEVVAN